MLPSRVHKARHVDREQSGLFDEYRVSWAETFEHGYTFCLLFFKLNKINWMLRPMRMKSQPNWTATTDIEALADDLYSGWKDQYGNAEGIENSGGNGPVGTRIKKRRDGDGDDDDDDDGDQSKESYDEEEEEEEEEEEVEIEENKDDKNSDQQSEDNDEEQKKWKRKEKRKEKEKEKEKEERKRKEEEELSGVIRQLLLK